MVVLTTDTSEFNLCSWLNVRHIFSFQGNLGVFRLTTDRKCSVLFWIYSSCLRLHMVWTSLCFTFAVSVSVVRECYQCKKGSTLPHLIY